MKITEQEFLIMLRVLEGSLQVHDRKDHYIFGYGIDVRRQVYDNIVNRQDELINTNDSNQP